MTLDQIDSINLTGAEIVVGSVIKGDAAPLADTKGINITLHNFAVSPMRMHDWQAESNLSSVTLALSGWKDPIAFHTGQFTLSGGKLDAQFVADLATAADIKGTVNVPDFEHPQVNFEMSSSQLDIDKLIDVAGSGPSGPGARRAEWTERHGSAPHKAGGERAGEDGNKECGQAPVKPAANAPAPAAKSELVARGHINIEKITTKPYTVGPANVEIRVYTDRAELWPISIGMYGGTLQISSRVDRVTDPARFTANVQMRNLDVAKVLDVSPSARGKMGGTGELDLQLLGSSERCLEKNALGHGQICRAQRPFAGRESGGRRGIRDENGGRRRRHAVHRARRRHHHRRPARLQQTDSSGFFRRHRGPARQPGPGQHARLSRLGHGESRGGPGLGQSGQRRGRTDRQPRRENHRAVRARGNDREPESAAGQGSPEFRRAVHRIGFNALCRAFRPAAPRCKTT